MFRWKQTCSTSITKWMYIFQNRTKHTHPEEDVMIAKSDIKMLWMKLSVFPPKGCTTPFWEILSKTEYLEFCNVKNAMTRAKAWTCTYRSTLHCWGFDWRNLVQGYLCITCWSYSETPIFISSKQWWIGMCCLYLGRMICDPGWTLQWFTELFVGRLQ